jgi:hypothetical protein
MRLWPIVSAVMPVWSDTKNTVRLITVVPGFRRLAEVFHLIRGRTR